MAPLSMLAFVACAALVQQSVATIVDCGGHFAQNCNECPEDNGWAWCNGQCAWVRDPFVRAGGLCVLRPSLPGLPRGADGMDLYYYVPTFFCSGFIMLIFAVIFYAKVILGPPSFPKLEGASESDERVGLFDCFQKPELCLYTTFCLPVIAGKNYHAAKICGFWPGCFFTYLLTYSPFYCFAVVIRALLSGQVKDKLGIENRFMPNLLITAFCMPCDVARESLEVDTELGAELSCCCAVIFAEKVVVEAVILVEEEIEKVSRGCDTAWDKTRTCSPSDKSRFCGPGH